ncbi:MAG: endonuclease/exonuclease/phosphatase family protein [Acidimicrobiia bacterium]|nr:endonuclease/exonuclease/phosphatase family protein [Acidimicrobiia bacterium]
MSLRILTANLYNGRARPAAFAEVLRAVQPHVVAVQELSENAAEVLAEWGVSRLLDPRDDTTGMGLATDVEASFDRLEFPYRNPVRATFDGSRWGMGRVEALSTHLANPISRPWRSSRKLRTAELNALEHLLGTPAETRIVVGDFNSSPVWPVYRRVSDLATDGAREAGTAQATWGYFPWSPAMLRIDHAFIQGARAVETRAVKIAGSDHRGLIVELVAAGA